jgi:hypothetical protein
MQAAGACLAAACPPEAAALRVASLGEASRRTSSGTAPESAIFTCTRGRPAEEGR